jgi:hypothetical protein
LWKLLELFAVHGGVLPFSAAEGKARENLKKYVSELRDRLAALLPAIDGDPISYNRGERAYRTAFKIHSEEGVRFLTPQGATWGNVSICSVDSSCIRISVMRSERFASSAYLEADEGGTHYWEPAEREGSEDRVYDLRTLRLADDHEQPTRAGQALLTVLGNKGVVARKADDRGMLELCGVLTELMGIKGSPFDFAPNDEKWVARFDTSSEKR